MQITEAFRQGYNDARTGAKRKLATESEQREYDQGYRMRMARLQREESALEVVKRRKRLFGYLRKQPDGRWKAHDEDKNPIPWPAFKKRDHAIEALQNRYWMTH